MEPTCEVKANGNKAWYLTGKLILSKLFRKPVYTMVDKDGRTTWTLTGKLHREDGPAVEYANGDKAWYLNGKRHRTDGPAVEDATGDK